MLYFFNAALYNLFLIHRKINNNKKTYKNFLLTVAIALIEQHESQYLGIEEAGPSNAIERTKRATRYDPPARLSQDIKTQISTNSYGWKKKISSQKM